MLYTVSKAFTDKTDKRVYVENDIFPHNINKKVAAERAEELQNQGYIEQYITFEAEEAEVINFPKSLGGGYYQLSNGEKVKGRDKAEVAEEKLKAGE